MTLDDLFKTYTDLEFQAGRILRAKQPELDNVAYFDEKSELARQSVLRLDIHESLNEEMKQLGRIDLNFQAPIGFGVKLLNIFTFGVYKKRYLAIHRANYFHREVNRRQQLFQYAINELKLS